MGRTTGSGRDGNETVLVSGTLAAVHMLLGRWTFLAAALVLAVGGALLAAGWKVGPAWYLTVQDAARMSARVPVQGARSFLFLDADLKRLDEDVHWSAYSGMRLCLLAHYLPTGHRAGDPGEQRVFCGLQIDSRPPERYGILDLQEILPGVAAPWLLDEDGNPVIELRLHRALLSRLRSEPATHTTLVAKTEAARWPGMEPGTELDRLLHEFDRPAEWLVRAWSGTTPAFDLAYDPERPERAFPGAHVDGLGMSFERWAKGIGLLVFGLFTWQLGIRIGFHDLPRTGRAALVALPLVAIPWWPDQAATFLRWTDKDAYQFAVDLASEIGIEGRSPITAHAPHEFERLEVVYWFPLKSPSRYSGLLEPFDLKPPQPAPVGEDAALSWMVGRIAEDVASMPDEDCLAVFERLVQIELSGLGEAGLLFIQAARNVMNDRQRSEPVRAQAGAFLRWLTINPLVPAENEPAFDARIALWRSLLDADDPVVRNGARLVLQKAGQR